MANTLSFDELLQTIERKTLEDFRNDDQRYPVTQAKCRLVTIIFLPFEKCDFCTNVMRLRREMLFSLVFKS
jgi:hypothetical protein